VGQAAGDSRQQTGGAIVVRRTRGRPGWASGKLWRAMWVGMALLGTIGGCGRKEAPKPLKQHPPAYDFLQQ